MYPADCRVSADQFGDPTKEEFIGPYAEDYRELFGVGDGKVLAMQNTNGILTAAVKALLARVEILENKNGS